MNDFIEDISNNKIEIKKEVKQHKEEFGVEPYIIGMFWSDQETVVDNILKAIEDGKPYNEYEMLTKEEQEAFDRGELLF